MKLNRKKTKSMVNQCPGYGEPTLGGAELEEARSMRILGESLDSNLTFETHLSEVVWKAVRHLCVVCRSGKLFDCSRLLKSYFTAYILSSLEYRSPVSMSSAESNLGLLYIVRSAERWCESEVCYLGHRRKVSTLCMFYKTYHRMYYPIFIILLQLVAVEIQLLWVSKL